MAFINWGKEHLTKHKQIDAEHKAVVEILNLMHEKLLQKREVKKLLYTLHKAMADHFDYEKQLMLKTEFKSYYSHNLEHMNFLAKMDKLVTKVKANESSVSISFLESCRDWLSNHLELKDRKLANHLIELKIK